MTRLSVFIDKQGQLLLENNRQAVLCAVSLALFPYTAWLSLALIALVTLRKGWQAGALICLPVMMAHVALSLVSIPTTTALVNTGIIFLPCYLAACTLYITTSWRAVAVVLFLQVMFVAMALQLSMPDVITAQYLYIKTLLHDAQPDSPLLVFLNDTNGLNQSIAANYLLGIQAVSVVFSAMISLMLARSVQSRLYYPEGFRREMLAFRGNKIGLLVLVVVFIAALGYHELAMNLLPILLFYFLLAGLSLSANALAGKKTRAVFVLLVVPLLLLPFVMLPVYVILGSFDSLFNLRVYFARA